MTEAAPAGGHKQRAGRLWLVGEAAEYTGVSRRTLHRRVDAWMAGDRSPYAVKGGRRNNRGRDDRLFDAVDAERVRLQERLQLGSEVTAEQWADMVAQGMDGLGDASRHVTAEGWFRDRLGRPVEG